MSIAALIILTAGLGLFAIAAVKLNMTKNDGGFPETRKRRRNK